MSTINTDNKHNIPKRSNEDYLSSSRSELVNHLKTEITKKPTHSIGDFLTKTFWSWIYHYFKSRFGRKFPYPCYHNNETGIYRMEDNAEVVIGIASDWATDTQEALDVAKRMAAHTPDYTIHVGDTYYVGAPPEIESNFVIPDAPWIRGKRGSFAVLGNHEMYARGDAFFENLLPTLGIKDVQGKFAGQKAGYFCLENEHWRILGLDTGYHSTGIPILEFLPWLAPDCHLDQTQIDWLTEVLNIGDPADKRGIVFLTHHQPLSAFSKEKAYQKPLQQLASLFKNDRKILWLWGHEHKLALYSKYTEEKPLSIYGRCIGNGGTPIEIDSKHFVIAPDQKGTSQLVGFDHRPWRILKNTRLGHNGYVIVRLNGNTLTLSYHDESKLLIEEQWIADTVNGEISGCVKSSPDSQLSLAPGRAWENAMQ